MNVKTGGVFFRITQNGESVQLLSSACRALVRRQSSVQRGGARARWTRTVVFLSFHWTHCGVQFCGCFQCDSFVCD